jgi:hypothetical protein
MIIMLTIITETKKKYIKSVIKYFGHVTNVAISYNLREECS